MMRTRALPHWCLCLLLALPVGCGGGSGAADGTSSSSAPLVTPGSWVVLGSSTAAGVGAPPGQGWAAQLAAQLAPAGVRIHNLARKGLLSSEVLPRQVTLDSGLPAPMAEVDADTALALTPTLMLLSFPSNDAAAGVPPADTVTAWQQVAAVAKRQDVATLVLGMQPRPGFTAKQRALQEQTETAALAAFGPCYVTLYDALAAPGGTLAREYRAADGDHLNAAGHALVHARVAAALASGRCVRLAP